MDKFYLPIEFIKSYINRNPPWGSLGEITYYRTYSRQLENIPAHLAELARSEKLTRENWAITIARVVEGVYNWQKWHCHNNSRPWSDERANRSAKQMYHLMFNMYFLPPGRGLWMMGTDYVWNRKNGAPLNNCGFVSTERITKNFAKPFLWMMDMLMLGVGIGADMKGANQQFIYAAKEGYDVYSVRDSREGWLDAIELLLNAYTKPYQTYPIFDYTAIREAGKPIRGFGGTSSGAKPLIELIENIKTILNKYDRRLLNSRGIADIFNAIGRCVVAGNIRRSAEILIGESNDKDFHRLKADIPKNAYRSNWKWASNNSVFVKTGQSYDSLAALTASAGEPGFIWLDNARAYGRMGDPPSNSDSRIAGFNPCVEQGLESYELCNLVEVNAAKAKDFYEFQTTLDFAFQYAKTVSLIPTHDYKTNTIIKRNRRVGVSLTGIQQAINRHGRRKFLSTFCENGYNHIRNRDIIYSDWLGIPTSVKTTTVKPSGTVSLLPGVTPGIHWPHSRYYYRVIRFASDSPHVEFFRKANYKCVDLAPNEPNTTAIYFPVVESNFTRRKADVSMWEQVKMAADMQKHWSDNGVSVTVTFNKNEAKDIAKVLESYETELKAVSFLPLDVSSYQHAPYQEATVGELMTYMKQLKQVDFSELVRDKQDRFCDGDKCEI